MKTNIAQTIDIALATRKCSKRKRDIPCGDVHLKTTQYHDTSYPERKN